MRQLCRTGILTLDPVALRRLDEHEWTTPDHQIVFEALVRLANVPPSSLRRHLPVEATRMGFPDIHWDTYINSASGDLDSEPSITQLVGEILAQSAGRQ